MIAGFAVVFGLWLISGEELVRSHSDVDRQVEQSRLAFQRGQDVLTAVHTGVLLGSIYLRDALIDPSPTSREYYRDELVRTRENVERVLLAYQPFIASPEEQLRWNSLQDEMVSYWRSREIAFAEDAPRNSEEAAELLRGRLVPARESILEIVESLSALQSASRQRQEREATQLHATVQTRAVWLASFSLVVGLIVAFVSSRHVGGLEREIERQRLAEQQNRLDLERLSAKLVHAQEEERRTLSRELHDAVGQALTAIKMDMAVALRGFDTDPRARQALEEARRIAESTLQNVRDLSQLLHPSTLDDFGLPEALEAYLRSFSTRTGIRAQLSHARMSERLRPEIEVCVYRVVQEALTNIARHSGASSCTVVLFQRYGRLQLIIEDDGVGIDAAIASTSDARRGLGLIGMRERTQAIAGTFVVENRKEGGTRVAVQLPAVTVAATSRSPQQLAG
jgi:signal transduction histidine kinase